MNVFVRRMVSEKLQIRLQFSRSIQRTKNEIENRNNILKNRADFN